GWGGQGNFIPIPFSSSISITVTNGSGSNLQIWYEVGYVTGVPNLWTRTRNLHVVSNSPTSFGLTQDQTINFVNATGLNRGRFLGLCLMLDDFAVTGGSPSFLEGPIEIYADGNLVYKTSGTEDYVMMSG